MLASGGQRGSSLRSHLVESPAAEAGRYAEAGGVRLPGSAFVAVTLRCDEKPPRGVLGMAVTIDPYVNCETPLQGNAHGRPKR
jgi:hypothetical protein